MPRLELEVMGIDLRPELDLLHLDLMLFLLRLPRLAGLLVLEFPVVHDPADGRPRLGSDLDEIQPPFPRVGQRFLNREDPDLVSLLVDHAHRADPDLFIYPRSSIVNLVLLLRSVRSC